MGLTGVADLDITACLCLMFSIFPIIDIVRNISILLAGCQNRGTFANPCDL